MSDLTSRQAAIVVEGLDVQIRCAMCENSMHTDRGCDGDCKYDEELYERIMQILDERIKPLPSTQPEIIRCKDCKDYQTDWKTRYPDMHYCATMDSTMPEDGFCSYAERRTDE